MFQKSKVLYLYCVDIEYVSKLTVASLPLLKLKCFIGPMSLPGSLKLKDTISCIIKVISSVEFQVRISESHNKYTVC